jgi:protein involved in polysaccharide export with SLBB domain
MRIALFVLLGLALVRGGLSQAPVRADYRIAPNDIVVIEVFGEKDLSREFRVTRSGTINYYFLGEISVAGKTTSEVREELTDKLNRDYLVEPQVTVDVKDYRVREVFVNGAVNKPGSILLTGEQDLDILSAIARAGGLTVRASENKIRFTRPGPPVTERTFTLEELRKGLRNPILLQAGDVIEVPEKLF